MHGFSPMVRVCFLYQPVELFALGTCVPFRQTETSSNPCPASCSASRPVAECVAQRNANGLPCSSWNGQFQISRVVHFAAKLAKFIGHRVDYVFARIRELDLHSTTHYFRSADVHHLASDDHMVASRLGLDL